MYVYLTSIHQRMSFSSLLLNGGLLFDIMKKNHSCLLTYCHRVLQVEQEEDDEADEKASSKQTSSISTVVGMCSLQIYFFFCEQMTVILTLRIVTL